MGSLEIGVSPIPPIIYKNQLIGINTSSIIYSFNVYTGKINWKFKVNDIKNSFILFNFQKGSPWGGLSLDEKRGLLFFTTGNPAPDHSGVDREGKNLHANSLVAFDLSKKKIAWYFQEIQHDIWNMDFAAPPILTMIKKENKNIDVVVGVSKLGNTIILDRESGEPIFDILYERTPISNVPGERTAPYQIKQELPEKICRTKFNRNELTAEAKKSEKIKKILKNYTSGFPTPPQLEKNNIIMGGCVRWAGASVDTTKNILYVSSDQDPYIIKIFKDEKFEFLYGYTQEKFIDDKGFPAIKPPWGAITALNLNTGKIIWRIPFGKFPDGEKYGLNNTGDFNRAGITATSGNLIFASGTRDKKIRAYNSINGEEVWSNDLPTPGSSPPTIYEVDGKQFVLVSTYEEGGNTILSYTLN